MVTKAATHLDIADLKTLDTLNDHPALQDLVEEHAALAERLTTLQGEIRAARRVVSELSRAGQLDTMHTADLRAPAQSIPSATLQQAQDHLQALQAHEADLKGQHEALSLELADQRADLLADQVLPALDAHYGAALRTLVEGLEGCEVLERLAGKTAAGGPGREVAKALAKYLRTVQDRLTGA